MQLRTYLEGTGTSVREFADLTGVTIFAVRKWLNGERTPKTRTVKLIDQITSGKVSLDDWGKASSSR